MTLAQVIAANKVICIGTTTCPFCIKAKNMLAPIAKDLKVLNINTMGGEGDALQAEIEKTYNHDTVPAVFIAGKFIGGFSETDALNKQGKLAAMVA
jgi:glutaredoxin 3